MNMAVSVCKRKFNIRRENNTVRLFLLQNVENHTNFVSFFNTCPLPNTQDLTKKRLLSALHRYI